MRTALVTGAARGIGAACVEHLVTAGWRVVAVDAPIGTEVAGVPQPLAGADDLDRLVERHGGVVRAHPADVRDHDALQAAVEDALAWTGRLDAAVAGAAVIGGGTPLWEADDALFDAVMDVDVRGVWNLARAAIPVLLDAPEPDGRFVAVSSAAGTTGLYGLGLYGAAKHAVVGRVRGLAADRVGRGVTAVAVAPGSTRTAMLEATRALYGLDDVEVFAAHQGLRRLLEPDEVGAIVAWLCEPSTAAINGTIVAADGGMGRCGGRAVQVPGVLRPLEQLAGGDQCEERRPIHEAVVHPVGLAGSRRPCGRRHRQHAVGQRGTHEAVHGALAHTGGTGDHGQQAASLVHRPPSNASSNASRCRGPKPRSRRLEAMLSFSISRRALTGP